jgi:hypothetical protein
VIRPTGIVPSDVEPAVQPLAPLTE